MALSDQKKIDFIMDIYPPGEDIGSLAEKIEETKTRINAMAAKIKSTEEAAARITMSRATMQLPPGKISDIYFQIKDTEEKLTQARQDLKDSEIADAQQRAEAEAKLKADEAIKAAEKKAEEEGRRKLLQEQATKLKADEAERGEVSVGDMPKSAPINSLNAIETASKATAYRTSDTCLQMAELSIKSILDTLNGAGCTACAARLVAIRELRKYQKKEAA